MGRGVWFILGLLGALLALTGCAGGSLENDSTTRLPGAGATRADAPAPAEDTGDAPDEGDDAEDEDAEVDEAEDGGEERDDRPSDLGDTEIPDNDDNDPAELELEPETDEGDEGEGEEEDDTPRIRVPSSEVIEFRGAAKPELTAARQALYQARIALLRQEFANAAMDTDAARQLLLAAYYKLEERTPRRAALARELVEQLDELVVVATPDDVAKMILTLDRLGYSDEI